MRLIDERLHAESFRNMYSEHGLLAKIRAVSGHVCHSLIVVSNCMPGSPQTCVPSSMSAQAFFSSSTLQLMKSTMSGWSASRITIFAARRVLPPDLMTPANASYPFMNDTGPDAVPPPASSSLDERIVDRFVPVPDPNLNSIPSVLARERMESIVSCTELMKQAEHCGAFSN